MASKYAPMKAELLKERERVSQLIQRETEQRSILSDTGDHESGNHPGDEGTETFEKEKSLAIQGNLEVILEEVDQALKKLEAGTYGQCEECGKEIPFERLEVRPQSTQCIACKSKVEHTAMVTHLESAKTFAA